MGTGRINFSPSPIAGVVGRPGDRGGEPDGILEGGRSKLGRPGHRRDLPRSDRPSLERLREGRTGEFRVRRRITRIDQVHERERTV